MDASKFTDADIRECVDAANKARGLPGEPDDMRAARALIGLPSTVGPWSGALRAHAREILMRKEKAEQALMEQMRAAERALSPLSDVARELLTRDRAAEDIARAMQGLPPIKVEVVNEPAREQIAHLAKIAGLDGYTVVVGVDFQRDGAAPLNHVLQAPTPPANPDPTTKPLDAMLRFLCGQPNGERWMGPRLHAEVLRIARKYRPDAQVEHRYTAGFAASLLAVCEQFDPGSAWRHLDREEQQEYLRLFDALRVAVNAVPASGVR